MLNPSPRLKLILWPVLAGLFLLACNISASLAPPPAATGAPAAAVPPTAQAGAFAAEAPAAPAPGEAVAAAAPAEVVNRVLAELQQRGLLTNTAAFVDDLGRDIAEKRVIDVYRRVSPSVVNVTTQIIQRNFFFEAIPSAGAGSGFVLDQEGHIITNYHVIRDAQQIEVTFLDESSYPATVVGSDPGNDIAVLKVEAPAAALTPVNLGDSATLLVGQRAIVIGNPFGQFGGTLTAGVISALNRSIKGQDDRQISNIIQTDAAINSGNSGGPLLDSAGRVIGINSAIFSPSGTSAGVGFSIPVNTLKRVLPDLLALGHYRHPWLGVDYAYRVTPGLADLLKLPVKHGLLLVEIRPDSPLARHNVQGAQKEAILGNQRIYIGGDILTAVNGQAIASLDELQVLLETRHRVGDKVDVTVNHAGADQTITMELAEEPAAQ